MIEVNPRNLKWARETAGLEIPEVAPKVFRPSRIGSPEQRLTRLENGIDLPTHSQLNRLSRLYHQPVIAFYLDTEPLKSDRGVDFRTLPEQNDDKVGNARLELLISNMRAAQSLVRDILEDEDATPLPFVGSLSRREGIETAAKLISDSLQFDINEFRRRPSDPGRAFKYLRTRIQLTGVFVLLMSDLGHPPTNSIPVSVFRGIALADDIAPFVIINRKDAKRAQSFSALHEVVHLWLGSSGVTGKAMESSSPIEQFCNRVAGQILLPTRELEELSILKSCSVEAGQSAIAGFADARNISGPMVAYSLRLANYIDHDKWTQLSELFEADRVAREQQEQARRDQERRLRGPGGPDANVVKRFALGEPLLDLALRSMANGSLTPTKASVILGVNPRKTRSFLYRHHILKGM